MTVSLVNVNPIESRNVTVQGGAYAEHEIATVSVDGQPDQSVSDSAFTVELSPGCGTKLELKTKRYANQPTLTFPWDRAL